MSYPPKVTNQDGVAEEVRPVAIIDPNTGAAYAAGAGGVPSTLTQYGILVKPANNFTRPANATAYASGQLVANSVTAGSVAAMSFANATRSTSLGGMIRRGRLIKSGISLTNASFRLHLYRVAPTFSNGDGGVWLTDNAANYIGALDITCDKAFTDGAHGNGLPNIGSEINFLGSSTTIYGVLEARAAYTPVSGEVFTAELEIIQF